MMRIIIFFILVNQCLAEDFYNNAKRGWFWFESKKLEILKENNITKNYTTALDELNAFQAELEEKKAAMIMRPSLENSYKYLEHQNFLFTKAAIVGENWQEALLRYPELNIVKDIPISQQGAQINREIEEKDKKQILYYNNKKFKLLFFYSGACEYCYYFADVLDYFSKTYGYKVASVTIDGKSIKKFPAVTNKALIQKFNITFTPSLFLYSDETNKAIPISYGFLSIDLLERNVLFALNKINNEVHK